MNKVPTAEEVLKKWYTPLHGISEIAELQLTEAMKEFANIIRKQALEAAAENAECECSFVEHNVPVFGIDKQSILNAYPESNIK